MLQQAKSTSEWEYSNTVYVLNTLKPLHVSKIVPVLNGMDLFQTTTTKI